MSTADDGQERKVGELRNKSDELVALINQQAADANERARGLELRAAQLDAIVNPRRLTPDGRSSSFAAQYASMSR
jgi:hypothetical protein